MDERTRHPSLRAYHSVWQLRFDVWSSIAELTKQLADPTMPPDDRPASERELGGLLAPVETYWATPGPKRVGELRELVAQGDYEMAHRTAEPIAREHGGRLTGGRTTRSALVWVPRTLSPP